MKKKILAIFLSLCMAMSLLPVTALAAEGEPVAQVGSEQYTSLTEAVNKAADGATIQMLADVDISTTGLTIPAAKSLTLDINGKQIEAANTATGRIVVYGHLTIKDSTDTNQDGAGCGKIYTETDYNGPTTGYSVIGIVGENASATMESGYIYAVRADASNKGQFGVGVDQGGDFTMTGGKIEAGWYAVAGNGNNKTQDSVINIQGGTLVSTADYAVYLPQSGTTTITGGTIYGEAGGVSIQRGTLNISGEDTLITSKGTGDTGDWGDGTGGQAAAAVNIAAEYGDTVVNISGGQLKAEQQALIIKADSKYAIDFSITGGTFSSTVAEYLTAGYQCTGSAEKGWTVTAKSGMEADVSVPTGDSDLTATATVGGNYTGSETAGGDEDGKVETENATVAISVTTGEKGTVNDKVSTSNVTIDSTALKSVQENDSVSNVEIATDVGTIKLDKQAWDTITENATTGDTTAQVTLSIKDVTKATESNTATYEITATANGEAVFAEDSATKGGTVTITVPAPTGVTQDNVHVYYLGPNGAEEVSGAKVEDKNVSWTVEHFSTYYLTGAEQVASITKNGVTTSYGTLSEAVTAAQEDDTIVLLANITDENVGTSQNKSKTVLTFDKSVTIQGNGNKISIDLSVPKTFGERDQVFSIGEDKDSKVAVTFDNVKMTVAGKEEGKGDAFDVWGTLNITKGSNITVKDAQSAFTMQGGENAKVNIDKASTVTANNIHGNFSNGGIWTIKEGSTLDINTAGNHGLSVEELTVNNSTVSVDGAAYTGILAAKVTLKNDANVTVTNCGKDLPQESQWAPDQKSYKNAMELKGETPTLTVDNSTLTLTNNVNKDGTAINSIYLGKGTLKQQNNPTINVDKIVTSDEATTQYYVVTYMNGNQAVGKDTVSTSSGSKEATVTLMKALPNQGYNHFVGWKSSVDGKTYQPGAEVTIAADTTFTAVWTYIPPANPNYRIDIPDFEGGTVTADPAAAKAGATVTLTATPDEGYAVGTITVTDRFGDAVKVTENADGTYTFTMPNGQVTVKATFVETEEPAPAEPFPDVDENDWFYDEVVYVYENGLMNGVENNQFAPNTATNRAMLATILYRLAGEPAVSGDLPFTDVESGTWYTDAVLWAAQNGIVNGLGEDTFAPMNTLTREQLVTMLYRYAEAEGYDVSAAADLSGYPDAGKVQPYAQDAMTWAVAEGIVEGMDGNLNPAGHATRAQIATILMRFCEGVAK